MIGEALRLIRVFHDTSVSDLATELEISQSYLSEIENGKKPPPLTLIDKYAKHFHTTTSAIMFFSEDIDTSKSKNKKDKIREILFKFLKAIENAGSK